MRYTALATDYDGTLALDGAVDARTMGRLRRLKKSGRAIILVTGRELPELLQICPDVDPFDRIVAENGGLLYRPGTDETFALTEPPSQKLVDLLRERGARPLSVGRCIIATREP